jgi:hypothetical protein
MENVNQVADTEQVSQDGLEAILKLAHSGLSPEAISSFFGLKTQTVQVLILNDPMHRARVVQSIKERSAKYRCTLSKRLMISPVMTLNEVFYEQSFLEADPVLSREQFIPSLKLKSKISDFSNESLKVLEGYLRQKDPLEDILELTAECLSVISHDAGLDLALRVLRAVEGETLRKLSGKLRGLVAEEMLLNLIKLLASELPSHALCLAALIILEPCSEGALEEAFRCFAELLSQADLGAEAINLAEELSERLSSCQLSQVNAALGAYPRDEAGRLDGLRLKEAYALLREDKVGAAIDLVSTLRLNPHLEQEVLRFFDEAGISSGKVPILEQRLRAKLEEISRESPSLAETLSIIHQLLNAELQSHKSEAGDQPLMSLRAEVLDETKLGQQTSHTLVAQDTRIQRLEEQIQRRETDYQETLTSLRANIQALTEDLVKTGQAATQTLIAQDTKIQRSEAATQESLISLRAELRALHKKTTKSAEKTKQAQSFIEQTHMVEAATQNFLRNMSGEVKNLRDDFARIETQCKRAQSAQEAMFQRLEETSQKLKTTDQTLKSLNGEVLKLSRDLAETSHLLQDTREVLYQLKPDQDLQTDQLHEDTLPTFIYSYNKNTDQLHRTNLATGRQTTHQVPAYKFKQGCCWSEVPGGNLIITGGVYPAAVSEVVTIDVGTFEVFPRPHMHTPRTYHAAVYHTRYLYVLGGLNGGRDLNECERYVCAADRWEALPPLPKACMNTSGVVLERSLYALGGNAGGDLDLVQRFSLESLTWELMQLRLPHASRGISCFKVRDTEVYLVVNNTLCSFTARQVLSLKFLAKGIRSWYGASYYRRGTLYCSSETGAVRSLEMGSLSN